MHGSWVLPIFLNCNSTMKIATTGWILVSFALAQVQEKVMRRHCCHIKQLILVSTELARTGDIS